MSTLGIQASAGELPRPAGAREEIAARASPQHHRRQIGAVARMERLRSGRKKLAAWAQPKPPIKPPFRSRPACEPREFLRPHKPGSFFTNLRKFFVLV